MKVFTGPIWLFLAFNGYQNEKGTAVIQPILDNNGNPIIGTSILDDPTWNLQIPVTSPENVTKPLIEWLEEIDYEPIVEENP
jgi:hypothetical protein